MNMNEQNSIMNSFVKTNVMGAGSARTENGAVSYGTIGTALLDQFGKAGTARGREYKDVWNEQAQLWAEDSESALRFPFYLRMITRKDNILGKDEETETVQRGQGARDEAFKRLLWIAAFHEEEFYRNLWLLPVIGSWKDLWTIMVMAENDELPVGNLKLKHEEFFKVFAEGINDAKHIDLVKKYMPRIRSEKKCTTAWAKTTNQLAKEFAQFAGWKYSEYREFKSTGVAHEFQRIICSGMYSNINWKAIPGKALLNLVSGKFLENHNLSESYVEWLKGQPTVKFNGYAYELIKKLGATGGYCGKKPNLETVITIDKQFDGLVATASQDCGAITGNVLCALDTSASMTAQINGADNLTSYDVCISLGIYFSELNKGAFHNVVAMFDTTSRLRTLNGTFSEKVGQFRRNESMGSTNFQSLIDLIVETRVNHPEIPLEEFPKTLLVVSDMQFDPCGNQWYWGCRDSRDYVSEQSNYRTAMNKLLRVFPEEFVGEFKIVWWYCAGRSTTDFPSTMDDAGTYMFSGFDPAVISFLLGGDADKPDAGQKKAQPSMEEIVQKALSQEALSLVQ